MADQYIQKAGLDPTTGKAYTAVRLADTSYKTLQEASSAEGFNPVAAPVVNNQPPAENNSTPTNNQAPTSNETPTNTNFNPKPEDILKLKENLETKYGDQNKVENPLAKDPLYIGVTNWQKLQKQYTPYQLEKATVRTKDGIYWNEAVNIGDIPRVDPATLINNDTTIISDLVNSAKGEADKNTSDKSKTNADGTTNLSEDVEENNVSIMNMLQGLYGNTAEQLYNELYNTPEMKEAQSDVIDYNSQLDKYDQELEELKNDIRKEVEGEASDSYISALASIRGEKILKMKRGTQRDYDTAVANLNNLKEEAGNLLQVKSKDNTDRYIRLFSMLQLQIQEQGNDFNKEVAKANIMMSLPEGMTMKIDGETITGIKETDNNNYGEYVDSNNDLWVYSVDKKTGEKTMTFIGKARATGSTTNNTYQYQLKEYEAKGDLDYYQKIDTGLADGTIGTAVDDDKKTYYYDKAQFDADWELATKGWWSPKKNPKKIDYIIQ